MSPGWSASVKQRKHQLHGRRIGQRIAPFLAGLDAALPQLVDQPGHGRVPADQHADRIGPGDLLVEPVDFLGGDTRSVTDALLLALRGLRRGRQAAIARQLVARRGVLREALGPFLGGRRVLLQRPRCRRAPRRPG